MPQTINNVRLRRPLATLLLALAVAGAVASLVRAVGAPGSQPPSGRLVGELTGRAPWPANGADLHARLAALGLPALSREGTTLHVHAHLDLFVDGRRVPVPAAVGIDPGGRFISPLHTHDSSGVIHVESPTVRPFTLGQFFGVWGVRFGRRCVGGYCAGQGRVLRVYTNGRRVADPPRLVLAAHQEIVVAFGTPRQLPRPVPARYSFAPGELPADRPA